MSELHSAAANGDETEVARLLAAGADVNARNSDGDTPLRITSSVGVAKWLLAKGADVNISNNAGLTPLHRACAIVGTELIHIYLHRGAKIEATTPQGVTPLLTAAMLAKPYQLVVMLTQGAKADVTNAVGRRSIREPGVGYAREVLLLFAALDRVAQDPDLGETATSVRSSLQKYILELIIQPYRPPPALALSATMDAFLEHEERFSRSIENLTCHLKTKASEIFKPEDLRLRFDLEIAALASGG